MLFDCTCHTLRVMLKCRRKSQPCYVLLGLVRVASVCTKLGALEQVQEIRAN